MSTIKPLPLVQATAPLEIWLQVSDEATDSAEQFPSDTEGVTWCADPVLGCEVPYVRADLAQLARRDQADTQAALQREYDHAVEQAARNADEVLALREERDQLRTYLDAAQRRGEVLRAENERLREALELAYGHLWLVNDEPGTPIRLHSSGSAASAARKILRDLITAEQRERGINAARAALAARAAQGEGK